MNFGTIMNSMINTCLKMIMENREREAQELAHSFISYVHLKKPLTAQFFVYDNLRNAQLSDSDMSKMFVQESLSILSDCSLEDVLNYNKLLESRFKISRIASSEVDTHIHRLIKAKLSEEDFDKLSSVKSFSYLVEYVMKDKDSQVAICRDPLITEIKSRLKYMTPKSVTRIAIKKFNKEYTELFTENDRKAFLVLKNKNLKQMKTFHKELCEQIAKAKLSYVKKMGALDADLQQKLDKSEEKLSSEVSADNILNAVELLEVLSSN